MSRGAVTAVALQGIPEIRPGDDLAALIATALSNDGLTLEDDDVLVIAHKAVSKAEGRLRRLDGIEPTRSALELAHALGKNPRHVQAVLEETREVRRADHGVLICVTHHGFVCANAGIDASNVLGDEGTVVLLPLDPDASARALRATLRATTGAAPAVLITDSFGRAWRHGQCDIAIGCAGLTPLDDWRGRTDANGRQLNATVLAVADELAAAADLARRKDSSQPVVLVRGAGQHATATDGPGAAALIRDAQHDLFR